MRLFLIDYENVNSAGLHGIGQIAHDDRVILFYSHAANTLSFEIMDEMMSAGIMPERVCLEQTGKNALDFQLVTFLGYLIASQSADAYYIISRDTGYNAAVAFCQAYLGVKVQIRTSIRQALGIPAKTVSALHSGEISTVQVLKAVQKPAVQKTAGKVAVAQPIVKGGSGRPLAVTKLKSEPKSETNSDVVQVKKAAKGTGAPAKAKPVQAGVRKKPASAVVQVQTAAASVSVPPQAIPVDLETVMGLVQPAVSQETAAEILRCLTDSHSKTEFHNALQRRFDNEDVKLYYHCMKPCFVTFGEN